MVDRHAVFLVVYSSGEEEGSGITAAVCMHVGFVRPPCPLLTHTHTTTHRHTHPSHPHTHTHNHIHTNSFSATARGDSLPSTTPGNAPRPARPRRRRSRWSLSLWMGRRSWRRCRHRGKGGKEGGHLRRSWPRRGRRFVLGGEERFVVECWMVVVHLRSELGFTNNTLIS